MSRLLAVESSGAVLAVGLEVDGTRFGAVEQRARHHNERLLELLDEVILSSGWSRPELMRALDAVAFGIGPGSFTGVRLAAAAAQAISLAGGGQVVRLSSSEVLAASALREQPELPGVITSIRSRRDLYYLAVWENDSGRARNRLSDQLFAADPGAILSEEFRRWPIVGTEPDWWTPSNVVIASPGVQALLDVALCHFEAGRGVDAALGLPDYLEGDAPWKKSR